MLNIFIWLPLSFCFLRQVKTWNTIEGVSFALLVQWGWNMEERYKVRIMTGKSIGDKELSWWVSFLLPILGDSMKTTANATISANSIHSNYKENSSIPMWLSGFILFFCYFHFNASPHPLNKARKEGLMLLLLHFADTGICRTLEKHLCHSSDEQKTGERTRFLIGCGAFCNTAYCSILVISDSSVKTNFDGTERRQQNWKVQRKNTEAGFRASESSLSSGPFGVWG